MKKLILIIMLTNVLFSATYYKTGTLVYKDKTISIKGLYETLDSNNIDYYFNGTIHNKKVEHILLKLTRLDPDDGSGLKSVWVVEYIDNPFHRGETPYVDLEDYITSGVYVDILKKINNKRR